jgi:hypothetical protein
MDISLTDEDKHGKRTRQVQRTGGVVLLAMFVLAAVFVAYVTLGGPKTHHYGGIPFLARKETYSDVIPEKVKRSLRLRTGKLDPQHSHLLASEFAQKARAAGVLDKAKGAKLNHMKSLHHQHNPKGGHGAHGGHKTTWSNDQKEAGHQDEHESAAHHQDHDATTR